ncbi:MAG: SBBP repeat-containing protein [Bacteroidia bacterium]|nr:SBBP repeat-containing protein [Bacteroidia bacterium]
MKKMFIKTILAICFIVPLPGKAIQKPQITFIENKGQVSDQNFKARPDVLFSGIANGMIYHLRDNGISYQLNRIESWKEEQLFKSREKHRVADQISIYRLDMNWLNINQNFTIQTEKTLIGFDNYYLEVCPTGVNNVKTYEGVFYNNIYNKINLHYYQKDGALKYDYIVKPGANYRQIQFQIKGADEIKIQKNGSVIFSTPLGKIEEGAPVVYQNRKQLKAKWLLKNNILSFDIDNYDPQTEMIIDPATRIWGTYYGDTGNDYGHTCTTDAFGHIYMTGDTDSNLGTSIATSGAHQSVYDSYKDAYLVKFDALGIRQWGTYYGGSGVDRGVSCKTDAAGNIYLVGYTTTTLNTVIATPGSHQPSPTLNNGNFDGFLVKFDSLGVRQWGTYYGGAGQDYLYSCDTDPSGNIFVTGDTQTSGTNTIIATTGSHQSINGGGTYDGFLVKFNSSGARQWGTYYGGTGSDGGFCCCTDLLGNVYMTGYAQVSAGTVIATTGAHQPTYGTGPYDAFLVKFNGAGIRQWGTYYGGIGSETAYSCATDPYGNIYIAGSAQSSTGIVIATPGTHQSIYGGGTSDAFLVKFSASGTRQWGTYYGGNLDDYGASCALDASANIYLCGSTNSTNGFAIATINGHQSTYGGGTSDAFLLKFSATGSRQWGTYYGHNGNDYGRTCATDSFGNVYLGGYTTSNTSTVIATTGSHQSTHGGGYDGFLVKFFDCTPLSQPSAINGSITICNGATTSYSIPLIVGATSYTWNLPSGWSGSSGTNSISVTSNNTGGIISVYAESGCTSSLSQTLNVSVNPNPSITVNSGSICIGNSFTLTPGGANSYTFSGGNSIVNPTTTSSYSVTGVDAIGCVASNTAVSTITVNSLPTISVTSNSSLICTGQNATLTASGAVNYNWNTTSTISVIVISPSVTTSYTVIGTDVNNCSNSSVFTQSVSLCTSILNNGADMRLRAYPNPSNGFFSIEIPSFMTLKIFDAVGKLIYNAQLETGSHLIDLSNVTNGLYILKFNNSEQSTILKLIIE